MSRTRTMAQLLRLARLAERSQQTGEDAHEVIGGVDLADAGRRRLLRGAAVGAGAAAAGLLAPGAWATAKTLGTQAYARLTKTRGVAVVGAGLAGLACAHELARAGIATRVFEAGRRVGGRCWSVRGVFPGQVAERGAEFIGSNHHAMLGYARALGLELESHARLPGAPSFHFAGTTWSEAEVLEEYTAFADCIRQDLATLGSPTADRYTEADSLFDFMSLDDYMTMYGAGRMLRSMVGSACMAEFGATPGELSAIGFLRFAYGDRRTKLDAYGAGRGEAVHVVGGNDRIATGLAERLPRPVELGRKLVAVRRMAGGHVRLTFEAGGRYVQSDHDAVVLAVPFSVLRDVDFHASCGLPAWKRFAIEHSTHGDTSKLLVGFTQPFWYLRGDRSGGAQADLPSLQTVWECNPARSSTGRAVLAHQAGGPTARLMRPELAQREASAFLGDLERVMPGAKAAARRSADGAVQAIVQNWSLEPLARGGYPYPRPGYFTSTAHHEAKPVGNLFFAGDHTSSFYEWQGFMEGAALSGLRAAGEARSLMLGA